MIPTGITPIQDALEAAGGRVLWNTLEPAAHPIDFGVTDGQSRLSEDLISAEFGSGLVIDVGNYRDFGCHVLVLITDDTHCYVLQDTRVTNRAALSDAVKNAIDLIGTKRIDTTHGQMRRFLRCEGLAVEPTRMDFFPCRNTGPDLSWEQWHSAPEYLSVPFSDATRLLTPCLATAFPLPDPTNNNIQETFDLTGTNWIGKDAWRQILKSLNYDDAPADSTSRRSHPQAFLKTFSDWITEQLSWADTIEVETNL